MPGKRIKASKFFNRVLKLTLGSYLKHTFNIEFIDENGVKKLEPPYILIANHTNFWDPFILSIFIPEPVYYVTSDYHFRNLVLKPLLGLVGAIPKTKSVSDVGTVKSVIRVKNEKKVIGVFPEGKRCWDGKSLELLYPIAKLIKNLGIPVVSVLMKGAYLSLPRWAKKPRKGKMTVSYKVILDSEDISQMTTDEIYKAASDSIRFDDYAYQAKSVIPFKGKRLAERMELFLFMCPHCKAIGTLMSRGNMFFCSKCGYRVRYDEYGFLRKEAEHFYFKTPAEWGNWQLSQMKDLIRAKLLEGNNEPIFQDKNVMLKRGSKLNRMETLHVGVVSFYPDRVAYTADSGESNLFEIKKIQGINVQFNDLFEFYYEKVLYTFLFKTGYVSAYKWVESVKLAKQPAAEKTAEIPVPMN